MTTSNGTALAIQESFPDFIEPRNDGLGVLIKSGMNRERWGQSVNFCANKAKQCDYEKRAYHFALCDLFAWGEENLPKEFENAYDAGTLDKHTLDNIRAVGKKLTDEERALPISFSHLATVAGIDDPKTRQELLRIAIEEKLPVSKLRALRNEKYPSKKRQTKPAKTPEIQPRKASSHADARAWCEDAIEFIETLQGAKPKNPSLPYENPIKSWPKHELKLWAPIFTKFRQFHGRAGLDRKN